MEGSVVFGGAGFIGRHLVAELVRRGMGRVVVADLTSPADTLVTDARFVRCDVRQRIDPAIVSMKAPAIFDLAAVHRTPGHADHEYWDTNEAGARNISDFARATDATRIWFTSSIAVYGPSESPKTERSPLEPESAYGKSKARAEEIYRSWAQEEPGRKLVIARPATVFGPGEGGNFTRLARAIRQRRFVYPGRRDTKKACGYVDDLLGSLLYMERFAEPTVIFNFAYPNPPTIEEVCLRFSEVAGYPRPRLTVPLGPMLLSARMLHGIRASGYHPDRVMKLVRSTNIVPEALREHGYRYQTDLREGFVRWYDAEPRGEFV